VAATNATLTTGDTQAYNFLPFSIYESVTSRSVTIIHSLSDVLIRTAIHQITGLRVNMKRKLHGRSRLHGAWLSGTMPLLRRQQCAGHTIA